MDIKLQDLKQIDIKNQKLAKEGLELNNPFIFDMLEMLMRNESKFGNATISDLTLRLRNCREETNNGTYKSCSDIIEEFDKYISRPEVKASKLDVFNMGLF